MVHFNGYVFGTNLAKMIIIREREALKDIQDQSDVDENDFEPQIIDQEISDEASSDENSENNGSFDGGNASKGFEN